MKRIRHASATLYVRLNIFLINTMNWLELQYSIVKLTRVSEREVRVIILIKYFNIFIFNVI